MPILTGQSGKIPTRRSSIMEVKKQLATTMEVVEEYETEVIENSGSLKGLIFEKLFRNIL